MTRMSNGAYRRNYKAKVAHDRGARLVPIQRPAGKTYTPNGAREVARRVRQIAAGQLQATP